VKFCKLIGESQSTHGHSIRFQVNSVHYNCPASQIFANGTHSILGRWVHFHSY